MKTFLDPVQFEGKWQKKWQDGGIGRANLNVSKRKYYLLTELPYPSGDLHMGHWFTFGVVDILARFESMRGKNIFMPIGFDAFGLPAENAAIKHGIEPRKWTHANIEKMKTQIRTMGTLADLENGVVTCDPLYFKWNQWIFLKMLEHGLAYRGKTFSNWCPSCATVLANENVEDGKCWRCGSEVVQKQVDQWFLKITEYAEKLLWSQKPKVDWPKPLREAQNNWIGKSEGATIEFKFLDSKLQIDSIEVYTTRPDTIFGATFLVLAPEHEAVAAFLNSKFKIQNSKLLEIRKYVQEAGKKSELARKENKAKTGVFSGLYVTNPANGHKIPVWIADYVLSGYGTGAIMAVPGSDTRDFEFATKFGLGVVKVIGKSKSDTKDIKSGQDVHAEGYLINSSQFNGLRAPEEAMAKIIKYIEKNNWGKQASNYHLHDWSISRQRYWGTPIPIIYCSNCWDKWKTETGNRKYIEGVDYVEVDSVSYAIIPVADKDLPVELPKEVDWKPRGKPPLATAEDWVSVKCPKCGSDARREVDTMDTFVDSSWYFLRYLDPKNEKKIFDEKIVNDWMPLEVYIGGSEHTLGHTLYSRFFVKFLADIGLVKFDEYAKKRVRHGIILGADGSKMSKSRGNVINPDEQVAKYGADAVRTYLAFLGPYDIVAPWKPEGIKGVHHFYQRVWNLVVGWQSGEKGISNSPNITNPESLQIMHKTIQKIGDDIGRFKFNTGVAKLMEWLNFLEKKVIMSKGGKNLITREEVETFLLLLAPYGPHITEELWEKIGNKFSIHLESWPEYRESAIVSDSMTIIVQVNSRVRDKIKVPSTASENSVYEAALGSAKVSKFATKGKVKKHVWVPGKLINLVV